jgi:hypothetical protein
MVWSDLAPAGPVSMSIGNMPNRQATTLWLPEEEGRSSSSNTWEAGSYRPRDEEADANEGEEGGANELGEGDREGMWRRWQPTPSAIAGAQPEITVER